MIQQANPNNKSCVSIVLATPLGGIHGDTRTFRHNHGYELAQLLDNNRQDLWKGIPREDEMRERELNIQREEGWRMDWLARFNGRMNPKGKGENGQ